MAWNNYVPVSSARTFEGVFEFNVVVPNSISSFEAFGVRQNQNSGNGASFQFSDANPYAAPAAVDAFTMQFAIHGAARVYGRQVLVGDAPQAGGVGRLQVLDTAVSPSWAIPTLSPAGPRPALRGAATYGRNGFMAVGDGATVLVTNEVAGTSSLTTREMDIGAWSSVDLHTVCAGDPGVDCILAPGENPNFYGVARVGDADVIVGDDLTVIVYRPQPAQWVPNGEVWHPWTRLVVPPRAAMEGQDATPTLRAVAVDEVQNLIRPDDRVTANADGERPPFLDSDGWAIAVGDDGAAMRFRIHLTRSWAGEQNEFVIGAAHFDANTSLPGPNPQILTATANGVDRDADDDGYVDGNFYGVTSDEQTRVIVGSNNKVFTFPHYAPFDDQLMQDRSPPPGALNPASITWRGVASDNVTWFLVGGATTTGVPALPVGAYWYGHPDVATCVVEYPVDPMLPTTTASFDLSSCAAGQNPDLPSSNVSDYRLGEARIAQSMVGEMDHHAPAIPGATASGIDLPLDSDPTAYLQIWKANLEHVATGRQAELLVLPELSMTNDPNDPFSVFARFFENVGFNRDFTHFNTSGSPATLQDGHVQWAFKADVFTGLMLQPDGISLAQSEVSDAGTTCAEPPRDQVGSGLGDTIAGGTELTDLIGGFSRFRSGAGHAFVDDYESVHLGKTPRYESMKHYVLGRCRQPDCGPAGCVGGVGSEWDGDCCVASPGAAKVDFVDLFAPFNARVVQFPPLGWQAPDDTRVVSKITTITEDPPVPEDHPVEALYPVGNTAGGRSCSFLYRTCPPPDPNAPADPNCATAEHIADTHTYGEISHDEGRLALFLDDVGTANDYKIAVVFDHVESCLDFANGPVSVVAGRRVAHFMTHGETEVQVWVNDRVGRWRLMSYFDELPPELYQIYEQPQWGFAPRDTYPTTWSERSPVVTLERRDVCPVLPEPDSWIPVKEHPDRPKQYQVCTTYDATGYDCPTQGCPNDMLWSATGGQSENHVIEHPGLPGWLIPPGVP